MSSFYLRTWSVGKHRASWNADMSIKVQVLYGFIICKSFNIEISIRFIKSESPPFLRKKSSVGTSHPQFFCRWRRPSVPWVPLTRRGLRSRPSTMVWTSRRPWPVRVSRRRWVEADDQPVERCNYCNINIIQHLFNCIQLILLCLRVEIEISNRELAKKWFWGIECRPLQEHLGTCEAGAWGLRPGQVFDHSLGTATKGSFEKLGTKFPDWRDSWLSQDAPSGDFHWLLPVVARLEEESGGWVFWFIRRNGDMPSENWMWRGVTLRFCFKEKT